MTRTLTTNGHAPAISIANRPPAAGGPAQLTARIAALQAAATFAAGVVLGSSKPLSSRDVLCVAEVFERWLLSSDRQQ